MNKKFFTNKILWILILLILVIIFFVCNSNDNKLVIDKFNNTNIIRKKINKKYSKSKQIYESPKINNNKPIKKMTNKLTKKLNKISEGFTNIEYKYIIRLFYADWCPHCVDFKPIWINIKNKYSNNIKFIEVDCTNNNPNLTYVTGFPTIALFSLDDKYIESYENDRSIIMFESYIKNKIVL